MWKVYYDDGTTYAGDPFKAPAWGVLFIVETHPDHGRHYVQGCDFYVWEERGDGTFRWWAADYFGMIDYLARSGPRKILIGRMVPDSVWHRVYAAAAADPDFPPKTAYSVYEVKRVHGELHSS